jgi:hypothetical protein
VQLLQPVQLFGFLSLKYPKVICQILSWNCLPKGFMSSFVQAPGANINFFALNFLDSTSTKNSLAPGDVDSILAFAFVMKFTPFSEQNLCKTSNVFWTRITPEFF